MKYSLVLLALLSTLSFSEAINSSDTTVQSMPIMEPVVCPENISDNTMDLHQEELLEKDKDLLISVIGQGVAPMHTYSPAQAYALAKRAAIADSYRLIAEKVKGVRVDGQDLIKNMMVKRSTVRTHVQAMVKNANIVETTFKEGLCEVEMEIVLSHSQFN
ncbi:hypothetical protein GJV85_03760 [Sulfurimonas aquatica]|uniref:Lipoprotein LPP20-like domain-containing protein n=1 Tax=Sulfurimonas aquatica TaxID=2672570 RepID=A0A975AZ59_9BACT|nr:LPP20 family lipoprotein [Sulfurimonas aquatica]QSZ41261.1 hypothetical protein GJV85_03760 [Sulfurimonas aquatica]